MLPLIVRAADGALDEAGRGMLDEHVASCDACREALAAQATVRRALAELPFEPVSPGFAAGVRARIEPRAAIVDLVNWRWWTLRLAPVAALLALLAWGPWPVESPWTLAAAEQAWAGGVSAEADDTDRALLPGAILFDDAVDSYDLLSVALEAQPQ
jgi:anti-sigma factor RsiW